MEASGRRLGPPRTSWVVCGAMAVAVAARLPLLHLPAWPDEAGFLTVGGAWHLGGSPGPGGLYGDYWVDRPPVLITAFGIADRLGGLTALRLLGAVAVAATVAGVAWIAHSAAGPRAARWSAVVVAALLCSPFHWAFLVDGELLALPAIALGIALVGSDPTMPARSALARSCLGGAMGAAAILTKQNFADVFVFAAAYLVLLALSRSSSRSAVAMRAAAVLAGALGGVALVAAWTVAHGTSLGGVFYAMYPFRLEASSEFSRERLADLGRGAMLSGLAVLAVWVVVAGVRRGRRDAHVGALLTVLVFDLVSISAGGNFWLHYLMQLTVPVAALAGIVIARGSSVRVVALLLIPLTLAGWVVLVLSPPQTAEELIGGAVGRVAEPGDSLVTVWGRADVGFAAVLPAPYPYLWVVPAHGRDPGARGLKKLLASDDAPTWLVTWGRPSGTGHQGSLRWVIALNYREAARICNRDVYVRRDVHRRAPVAVPRSSATQRSKCRSITVPPVPLRQLSR